MNGRIKWLNDNEDCKCVIYKNPEDFIVGTSPTECQTYKTIKDDEYTEFNLAETAKGYQAFNLISMKKPGLVK